MSREYKKNIDLPDLYNILGLTIDVCKKPDCDSIIQKAYIKKAKACHPDKHPGRKDVAEIFRLLTEAYDILKDEKQRELYNCKLSLDKQSSSDFNKLKQNALDYVESLGEFREATDEQKKGFGRLTDELNKKHGYDPSQDGHLTMQSARKRMEELTSNRQNQDANFKPERLFNEGIFDQKKFNAYFDIAHKKDNDSIVPHEGLPSAWDGSTSTMSFSPLDDVGSLYVDDRGSGDGRQMFSGIDFGTSQKLSKQDLEKLIEDNSQSDDYFDSVKSKLEERKSSSSNFNKMTFSDYQKECTAGYGIFDKIGLNLMSHFPLDIDEDDIAYKFEKLMEARKKEQKVSRSDD